MYRRIALTLSILMVLVVSCSDAEPAPTTLDAADTTTSVPEETTTTTEAETTTTTTTEETTTTAATTTSTLAGDPFDIGPMAGDVLMVVGVAFDDVLNVRTGPGTDQPIVATLDPLFTDVVATGEHRIMTSSIWNEITAAGVTGWASARFMAFQGPVDDVTSRLIADEFGGVIPTADSMLELGMLIADAVKSDDPASVITVAAAPNTGDLGDVVIDVIGLGDDSLFGLRLHVFGQPADDGTFSLKSVEQWSLCGRGLSNDGLCT